MGSIEDRVAAIEAFVGIGAHDTEPDVNVGAIHAGHEPDPIVEEPAAAPADEPAAAAPEEEA